MDLGKLFIMVALSTCAAIGTANAQYTVSSHYFDSCQGTTYEFSDNEITTEMVFIVKSGLSSLRRSIGPALPTECPPKVK
jgi:hypothetical protein